MLFFSQKMLEEETEVISELNLNPPTKEMVEWAKENIREDPDKTCQLIEDLRDIIYSKYNAYK